MRSKFVALLFSDLSINASHSRPRVSNDNPFSESQFRTLKYRPEFPDRFGSLEHARGVSRDLFAWYNNAHHHSGLSYLTPADVHYGRAATVLAVRHRTRLTAYAAHPERFVQGPRGSTTSHHAIGAGRCEARTWRWRTSVSQSLEPTGHFVRLHLRLWLRDRSQNRRIL